MFPDYTLFVVLISIHVRMHMMSERSREKFSLQRMNGMIWLYGFSYFSSIIAASRLYTLLLWSPYRRWWRRLVVRMSHVLSLLLADRKLVSFPALSFDSIEPEGCSDIKLGAYGKYALSIVTPKAIISAATSIVERRLPCWLYIG